MSSAGKGTEMFGQTKHRAIEMDTEPQFGDFQHRAEELQEEFLGDNI